MLHAGALSLSVFVCGDGRFNLDTFMAPCSTSLQTHPAPESNLSDSGQARLLKPAIIHTHTQNQEHQGKHYSTIIKLLVISKIIVIGMIVMRTILRI